jgi:hypothetical protein
VERKKIHFFLSPLACLYNNIGLFWPTLGIVEEKNEFFSLPLACVITIIISFGRLWGYCGEESFFSFSTRLCYKIGFFGRL